MQRQAAWEMRGQRGVWAEGAAASVWVCELVRAWRLQHMAATWRLHRGACLSQQAQA